MYQAMCQMKKIFPGEEPKKWLIPRKEKKQQPDGSGLAGNMGDAGCHLEKKVSSWSNRLIGLLKRPN